MQYRIRPATINDSSEIARLFTVLGHPRDAIDVESIWNAWSESGNSALVAAVENDSLAGVLTLGQMLVLHRSKPVGRITSLVVDEPFRGAGIGRALVQFAEDILRKQGCGLLESTSNLKLVDAHRFYEHLGFRKTSIRLAKVLTTAD